MQYESYKLLLTSIDSIGEKISPSDTSLNRSFETKELNNIQLMFDKFKQFILDDNEVEFLKLELDWYLDRIQQPDRRPIEINHNKWTENWVPTSVDINKMLKEKAKELVGCVNRCGPNSNYGEMCLRLKNHVGITQLDWVVEKLSKDKSSRQAVTFYNSPNYQYYSNQDFVCTLNQMFNIKDNKLNTVVNIRSNDLINCFRFDSIWYYIFQNIVLNKLKEFYPDLEIGYMLCNIASAHYYIKDYNKLKQIVNCENFKELNIENYI